MATVVKNFRIKSGLIVEGTTGTINGQNILTETGGDAYILNVVGGSTLVKSVEATQLEVSGAGKLSVKSGVFDASGAATAAQSAAISAASSDATTKASAAQSAAITAAATDATTKVAAEAALRVSGDSASVATAAADATTKANAARAAAEATAAAALSTAISTEVSGRNTAISAAVSTLVDGAPALLDTLNEIAAAINDDANYTTTITTALATKAPLASPALTGTPTAPTAAANTDTTQIATTAFAKAEADAAQSAAEATAAADATTKANAAKAGAEATAAAANTAQQNGTTAFTKFNYNDFVSQYAVKFNDTTIQTDQILTNWPRADYQTAKCIVKFECGAHTQISEVLIATDSANNVAITEYGIVATNGELGTITATNPSGRSDNVFLNVSTLNNNTLVTALVTLIK